MPKESLQKFALLSCRFLPSFPSLLRHDYLYPLWILHPPPHRFHCCSSRCVCCCFGMRWGSCSCSGVSGGEDGEGRHVICTLGLWWEKWGVEGIFCIRLTTVRIWREGRKCARRRGRSRGKVGWWCVRCGLGGSCGCSAILGEKSYNLNPDSGSFYLLSEGGPRTSQQGL